MSSLLLLLLLLLLLHRRTPPGKDVRLRPQHRRRKEARTAPGKAAGPPHPLRRRPCIAAKRCCTLFPPGRSRTGCAATRHPGPTGGSNPRTASSSSGRRCSPSAQQCCVAPQNSAAPNAPKTGVSKTVLSRPNHVEMFPKHNKTYQNTSALSCFGTLWHVLCLIKTYQNIPKHTRTYQNIPKPTKTYQNMPKHTRTCQH